MTTAMRSRPAPAPVEAHHAAPGAWVGWASLAGRLVLGGVFIAAALTKVGDPASTVRAVRAYDLVPEPLVTPLAHALPPVELALAAVLLAGVALRVTGWLAAGLLAAFTTGVVTAAARGLQIDCGCFGGGGTTTQTHYLWEITRDLMLLAVAVGVALAGSSRLSFDSRRPRHAGPSTPGHGPRVHTGTKQERKQMRRVLLREAEQRAMARRRRWTAGAATGFVLVAAPVGILATAGTGANHVTATPPGVTSAGGVLVGSAAAPHHVVLFEDPQCPACGQFERTGAQVLAKAVAEGRVQVEYRMRSFLGPESVRAVAALGAAVAYGRFEQLREALYADQPREHTGGFSIAMLIATGRAVGLTDPGFAAAVRAQTYAAWARAVDDRASRDGDVGTPELRLDGRTIDPSVVFDPARLASALGVS